MVVLNSLCYSTVKQTANWENYIDDGTYEKKKKSLNKLMVEEVHMLLFIVCIGVMDDKTINR